MKIEQFIKLMKKAERQLRERTPHIITNKKVLLEVLPKIIAMEISSEQQLNHILYTFSNSFKTPLIFYFNYDAPAIEIIEIVHGCLLSLIPGDKE